jgi:hypothetical protein
MSASTDDVGGECARSSAQDELEGIFRVYLESGKFSGGIRVGRRYGGKALIVSVYV